MTNATETSTNRTAEILTALDGVIAEHDAWVDDPNSDQHIPPTAFDKSVAECAAILLAGRVPVEISDLTNKALAFLDGWERFLDCEPGFAEVRRDGRGVRLGRFPHSRLWGLYRQMLDTRANTKPPEPRRLEPVSTLLSQGLTAEQIAVVYGHRDEQSGLMAGPFFDAEGKPVGKLVILQAKFERGEADGQQILGDGDAIFTPSETHHAADESELQSRLERIKARTEQATPPAPTPDKGSPEELARGGAYPHQVKAAFNLTDEQVSKVYESVGMTPDGSPITAPSDTDTVDDSNLRERLGAVHAKAQAMRERREADAIEEQAIGADEPEAATEESFLLADELEAIEPEAEPEPETEATEPEPEPEPPAGLFDNVQAEPISQTELEQLVIDLHKKDGRLSAADIGRSITEQTGQHVDGRSVAAILMREKRDAVA